METARDKGMRPETSAMLMHMFDAHVSMTHLAPYMDANGTELDLGKVLEDPMIARATAFVMFFEFLLKFWPSSRITARYLKEVREEHAASLDATLTCIAKQVPIATMLIKSVPYQVLMQEHARIQASCTRARIRQYVCEKLYMRYGLPAYVPQPPDDAYKVSQAFSRCLKESAQVLRTICPHDAMSCMSMHDCHAHCMKHMDLERSHHFTDARVPLPESSSDMPEPLTVFDALMHTTLSDSSLWILLHGAHVLFVPGDIRMQQNNYSNVCLGILAWMNARHPQGNIVVVAHPDTVDALKERRRAEEDPLDFNVHYVRLMDDRMLHYLPQVCGSFVALSGGDGPPLTSLGAAGVEKATWIFTGGQGDAVAPKEWTFVALPKELCGTGGGAVKTPEFVEKYIGQRHRDPLGNNMLFLDFLLKYYSRHSPENRGELATGELATPEHAVVLIDNRPNILNVICAEISMFNLDATKWKCVVFCPPSCCTFYQKHLPNAEVITSPMPISPKRFAMPLYNQFLKSEGLWEELIKYDRVLMVQDDGLIVRKGLDDGSGPIDWMSIDYVGAVWDRNLSYNDYMKTTCPTYVGNGGLSLRNPKVMLKILKEHGLEKNELHFDCLQEVPEDVYFAKYAHEDGHNVPSYEDAKLFSSEQVLTQGSLGFHKAWLYHSHEDAREFFDSIMNS